MDLGVFSRLSPGKAAPIILAMLLALNVGCGPSDEEVTQAAEESIYRIAAIAVANLKCSVDEVFSGGSEATRVMETNSDRMEELTDSLQNNLDASNREKMRAIDEMDDLYDSWGADLEEIGCELPNLEQEQG